MPTPLRPLAPALHSLAIRLAIATGMLPMVSACMPPMVSACMPPMVSACSSAHCALVVAHRSITYTIGDIRVRCTSRARIIPRGWMGAIHWHEIILSEERVAHATPRGIAPRHLRRIHEERIVATDANALGVVARPAAPGH